MNLQPGDIFCINNPKIHGRMINFVQKMRSSDNESKYSHSGIITSEGGDTFESLWTIRKSTLTPYTGHEILIGRNKHMTLELYQLGWKAVKYHEGQRYPFWRIPLNLFSSTSKIGTGNWADCSEMACKFLEACDLVGFWKGKNPDNVADMIHKWKGWSTVFEGVL